MGVSYVSKSRRPVTEGKMERELKEVIERINVIREYYIYADKLIIKQVPS